MLQTAKPAIFESLESAQDNFHGYTVFLLAMGIVFLFLTLTRFMLGIMSCLDLIFNDTFKKSSKKDAKKRASKENSSKKKKRRSSKTSSKSKTSKSSTTKAVTSKKEKTNELKKRRESTSPKGKPKLITAKKEDSSRTDSSKKEGPNSSSARKQKRCCAEKRRGSDTNTSNSSSIKATSIDLLAAPKHLSTATAKGVTFNNVPEPASNTAYKYASVAATWPGAIPQDPNPKLYKSDDCPTPNPFKDPAGPIANPPYILGAPKAKTPKTVGDSVASAPTKPSIEYTVYEPHEVPSQFFTDNVKTAVESSSNSPSKKNHPLKTPTKKQPSQTVIQIPPSPAFSIQSTPPLTSDTQQSVFSVQSTPQATSDTQNSLTLQSPVPKTAEEKKL